MNDMLQMGSALLSYINSNGTIPFYYQKAPQNTQKPYGVIVFSNGQDDYDFNSKGVDGDYFIKIISDRQLPYEAIVLYGEVHDLIQDAPLTSNSFTLRQVRRESLVQYQDDMDFWNVGGLYNFDIWET